MAVTSQDQSKIFILGGKDADGERTDSIQVYNCQGGQWSIQSDLTLGTAKSGFAAVSYKDKIIVMGGNDGKV